MAVVVVGTGGAQGSPSLDLAGIQQGAAAALRGATALQSAGNFNGNPASYYSGTPDNAWKPPANEPTNNLPFDSRGYRAESLTGQIIQSGKISTEQFGQTWAAYFQFNPTELDISYEFDTSVIGALPPQYNPTAQPGQSQGLMLNQTVSLSLLFDRTYEVWTGANNAAAAVVANKFAPGTRGAQGLGYWNGQGPYKYGAQWDVWAVERLVGIFGQVNGGAPSGPPVSSLVNVNLGGERFGQSILADYTEGVAGGDAAMGFVSFQGWITSLEATYTRFDANMVPTRASVQLQLMKVYSQGQQSTANAGDSSTGSPTPAGG